MALDALTVHKLAAELKEKLVNGRIDKIYQPEKDEILLGVRTRDASYKVTLSAASGNPRVHITDKQKNNPKTPPMFCMLMRKHLSGGKIIDVHQNGFERIIEFDIESYNELGDLTTKRLIAEIMGRHSNIILTNSEGKIIDSIKHVDFTVSSVRQILPGLLYTNPPIQKKIPFSEASADDNLFTPGTGTKLSNMVMDAYCGISPVIAREIVYAAHNRCDITITEVDSLEPLMDSVEKYADMYRNEDFHPCIVTDKSGKTIDFSVFPVHQYENMADIDYFDSINEVVENFYYIRDAKERMKQKSAALLKLLNTHLDRASKKLNVLTKTLNDAKNKDIYKIKGDLITANMYQIEPGAKEFEADNYYDPNGGKIKITLDPSLSPSQNAQRYYKKYSKAKTAETEVAKQLAENKADIEYLESTLSALENAESEEDLNAIKTELTEEGYIQRRSSSKKNQKLSLSKPMHFISSDGFDIYVGRNNSQNDFLTLKFANSSDIWFHTKNIHGSHVIIKLGIDKDIPKSTMLEAARLAAYYSKGRDSSQVPVDYTQIKNVKKPNGAKPGMVIYDDYNTVYVTPYRSDELPEKI